MNATATWIAAATLGVAAAAAGAQTVDLAEASARCEAEVASSLQQLHGRAARELRFEPARRQLARSEGDDVSVRGEGRHQLGGATVGFRYSCAYNARSGEASGVVLRETSPAAARAWEPDLARVTPSDCEAATAALLKERNPRIARIAFDAETRRLEPADNERIGLEGRGALQRAPGMLALPFSYRCEFDGRNGRVVAVQARD